METRSENNNRKLKNKLKKSGYIISILLGIILIIISIAFFRYESSESSESGINVSQTSAPYDVLMGIGCGLLATGIGTMLITFLLSDLTETKENLDEWGIEGIYGSRSSLTENDLPKKHLDIAAFGLAHFRTNVQPSALEARIKEGLEVRLLIPNPNSEFIIEQQKQSGNHNLQNEISELIKWVKMVDENTCNKGSGYLKYQVYDSLPLEYYCRADNIIDVGPYIPGQKNTTTITYRFSAIEKGGVYYSDIFDKIWSGQVAVGITEKYELWVPYSQKEAVENCLKYFANIFQQGITPKIVGIVAIFKDSMRRTFYSCNKDGPESHKSHGIEKGTVGVLKTKNNNKEKMGKIFIFCDYAHNIEYEYANLRQKKLTVRKVQHHKLDNNEECVAILAAPLVKERVFIGVLTFDFAGFPQEYNDNVSPAKAVIGNNSKTYDVKTLPEIENVHLRETLCYTVKLMQTLIVAGDLIVSMLGQYALTDYKKLYEEEWHNDD